jgi:hypothetical protein
MQGNLFLSSLSSAFSLERFATTCDRRSTIWFLSWLSWIPAPSKTALIPIDDTPQNFQVGTAVDIACDFVGLSRRRSSRHHRLEARNGTIEIGSQLLFGLGPNIVSAGCSCMCLAPGPQVASRESGRPVLPNSALICSRPERRASACGDAAHTSDPIQPRPMAGFCHGRRRTRPTARDQEGQDRHRTEAGIWDVARSSPPANNKRRTLRLEGKSPKGGSNHSNELSVSRLAPYPLHLTVPTDDCGQTNWVPTELGCGNAETASLTCAR